MSLSKRTWNLANLLVIVGFLGLGATFVWPYLTATRVARVEDWAENIGARLLAVTLEHPLSTTAPGSESGEALTDSGQAIVQHLGGAEGDRIRPITPPAAAAEGGGLYFEGKHYAYALLSPPTRDGEPPTTDGIEVYAWPLSSLGPGRTAFYFAGDGSRAYTHNLHSRYEGWRHVPRAGSAQAFHRDPRRPGTYRAQDGERWLELRRGKKQPSDR